MIKKIIQLLSNLFPSLFVSIAFDKLANPQIRKLREREIEILKTSIQKDLPFQGFNIKTYHWKGNSDSILLIHGWEGQAGNFSDLILKLKEKDYNIYAFDAPSHGFSSKGNTSLMEFTQLVGELIQKYQVKKLISHSFGGVATTYALYQNLDLQIDKYALITTPDKFSERIDDVRIQYGISHKVIEKLKSRIEKDYKIKIAELNVSSFVKDIRVKDAMIIHDKNDKVVPIERSKNVYKNWQECKFKEIEGTGHFRILRDEKALDEIIRFIN